MLSWKPYRIWRVKLINGFLSSNSKQFNRSISQCGEFSELCTIAQMGNQSTWRLSAIVVRSNLPRALVRYFWVKFDNFSALNKKLAVKWYQNDCQLTILSSFYWYTTAICMFVYWWPIWVVFAESRRVGNVTDIRPCDCEESRNFTRETWRLIKQLFLWSPAADIRIRMYVRQN